MTGIGLTAKPWCVPAIECSYLDLICRTEGRDTIEQVSAENPEVDIVNKRKLIFRDKIAPMIHREFSMSKFAIGEEVENAIGDHEVGTVIAVFPTVESSFRYAVDTEGYGTLQFFTEENLVLHLC